MKMRFEKLKAFAPALIIVVTAILFLWSQKTSAQQSTAQHSPGPAESQTASPATVASPHEPPAFREDWSSISIDHTDLHAVKPLLGNTDDLPQNPFVSELYQVQWRPQDPLDLYVIKPRNVKNPPVILYLYSFPWDTERFKNAGWCTRVTAGGYAAVGFVSALTGHRFHDRPMKEWFVSELQESLGKSVHDVQMILNYLSTRDDLDMSRVGIFGTGSGGAIAIMAAAADPRIKAVDALDPWGDWPDWLAKTTLITDSERSNYVKPEFLAKVTNLDPVKWLPKLTTQSVRIQDNAEDTEDPLLVQKALEAAAPQNAEIDQFGDSAALTRSEGGGVVFEWIKAELKTGAEVKTVAADQRVHVYPAQGKTLVDKR